MIYNNVVARYPQCAARWFTDHNRRSQHSQTFTQSDQPKKTSDIPRFFQRLY